MKTWSLQCPHCLKEVDILPTTLRYIRESDFSPRTYNALTRNGIDTFNELEVLTDSRLLKKKGLGPYCLAEIRTVVPDALSKYMRRTASA